MRIVEDDNASAAAIAGALLAAPVERVERVTGNGRNSRVHCVESAGRRFALKLYPELPGDTRDRLRCETEALHLMVRYGIPNVPRVVAVDPQRRSVLLTWIDGVSVCDITAQDIAAATVFLDRVHALRGTREAEDLPLAAEACLSGGEIERQIRARYSQLAIAASDQPELAEFLASCFASVFERALAHARVRIEAAGLPFGADLPRALQSLVAADFAFHNALRRADGTLAFLDFEYFGWDDPVRLTADFLLHPGMALRAAQQRDFLVSARERHGDDPAFCARLYGLFPLFGLRWTLILLNEFLPARWRQRARAGAHFDWSEAKRRQLLQARAMLARVSDALEGGARWGR